jgi:hypothetical protein
MTKQGALDLYINLNKLGNLKGVKFAYGVSKNVGLLKAEIDSLDKASAPTEEYQKFDAERLEIVKKFAKKDDKGEPIIKDNNYEMASQKEFDTAFDALKVEHKEVWEARVKQLEEYSELLKTDSAVVLYKIALSEVPTDITVTQMYSISALVEESTPSPYGK